MQSMPQENIQIDLNLLNLAQSNNEFLSQNPGLFNQIPLLGMGNQGVIGNLYEDLLPDLPLLSVGNLDNPGNKAMQNYLMNGGAENQMIDPQILLLLNEDNPQGNTYFSNIYELNLLALRKTLEI